MLPSYHDITDKLGEPKWYTQEGYPRYCDFSPDECGVYSDAVALIEIACQNCSKKFLVAVEYWRLELINLYATDSRRAQRAEKLILDPPDVIYPKTYLPDESVVTVRQLREALQWIPIELQRPIQDNPGSFGFGDPPNHGCIGDTMGCEEIRVVEYWERHKDGEKYVDSNSQIDISRYKEETGNDYFKWVRYPEYEVSLCGA